MNIQSNWDYQHRKEVWDLIIDASSSLKIPLSPTIATAFNYIHLYFDVSGNLDLSLFHIAILATFIASKTQETFCKADDLINAFIIAGLQRDDNKLKILGTDSESLNSVKNQESDIFEDFRKTFLDSELDFMTAMRWNFPDHVPFYVLKKWFNDLKDAIGDKEFDQISNELISSSTKALCYLILFPDSLNTRLDDLAASAFEYAWRNLKLHNHWTNIIDYDAGNETFFKLLNRLEKFEENNSNDCKK